MNYCYCQIKREYIPLTLSVYILLMVNLVNNSKHLTDSVTYIDTKKHKEQREKNRNTLRQGDSMGSGNLQPFHNLKEVTHVIRRYWTSPWMSRSACKLFSSALCHSLAISLASRIVKCQVLRRFDMCLHDFV